MKKIVLSKRFLAMLLVMLMAGQMLMPSLALAEGEWVSEVSDQIQTAKYYGVQFVVDGTDFTKLNVEAGFTLKTLPEAPAKEGYIFLGWMGEDGIPFSTKTVVNGDMRITARYAVQESMPESSLFTFEDRGDYTSAAFEGTYMNEAPTVRRIDGFAVEDGEITYRVLEAWGMRGLKEATAGNVQTMLDAWGVENQGTGFIARLTITALPEADTTQSYSVFSMNGNQLGDVIARNVAVGDVVELPLTYDLDNGIALVEISDDALIAYSQKTVWSNEEVYLTGWLPEGAVVEAKPVNGVEIDGREALVAYDIKIYASEERRAQGKIWQPADKKIKVHFFNKDFAGQTLEVYHIPETKNIEPELVETIENAKSDWVSFDAEHFSVYAVIGPGPGETIRATYVFKNADGTPYYFINNAGDSVDNQIIKDGEYLEDVGRPDIDPHETFNGWFLYENDAYGEEIHFGEPITVTETVTYEVRPSLGDVAYLSFYEDSEGTNIYQRVQVPLTNGSGTFDISTQAVTAPKSNLAFMGWNETPGEDNDSRTAITNTTVTVTGDKSYYPVYKSAHWIHFNANPDGQTGASYTAPKFVLLGQTAASAKPANPTWKGHAFQYWSETKPEYDANGNLTNNPPEFNFNQTLDDREGDVELYAVWRNADTTYTVIFWKQKVTDSKTATDAQKTYDYGGQETEHAVSGSTVTAASFENYYEGFTVNNTKSDASITVNADGSSVINVYFDRKLVTMQFYRNGTSAPNGGYGSNVWSNGTNVTTFTGLYGQTLAQNGYSWPGTNEVWTYYTTGNDTQLMSYLGQFVLPDNVRDTNKVLFRAYRSGTTSDSTIYFLLEQPDGSFVQDASGSANGWLTFNFSEKYDEYTVSQYRRWYGNATNPTYVDNNWVNTSNGQSVQLYNQRQTRHYNMYVRYRLKTFQIKYLDSTDNTELTNVTFTNTGANPVTRGVGSVKYTAPLNNYQPPASIVPVSQYPGKVWDGKWYADQACTVEFDWTDTMPNADVAVYAGWEDVWYRVEIDPNGGELSSTESTYFWLKYGGIVQEYKDVTRNYVQDSSGEYYYLYNPWNSSWPDSADGDPAAARIAEYSTSSSTTISGVTINSDGNRYAFKQDAYSLVGWYKVNSDGSLGEPYDFSTQVTENIKIRAVWRMVGKYSVRYDLNAVDADGNPLTDEEGNPVSATFVQTDSNSYADKSETAMLGKATPQDGYVFEGWYYNGKVYNPGDIFQVLAELADSNNVVHVKPVFVPYDSVPVRVTHIHWYANNGTDEKVEDNDLQLNANVNIRPANQFSYEGHEFIGWGKSAEGAGAPTAVWLAYDSATGKFSENGVEVDYIAADEIMPYDDLYAMWKLKEYTVTVVKDVDSPVAADQTRTFSFRPSTTLDSTNFALVGDESAANHSKKYDKVPFGTTISIYEGEVTGFDTEAKYTVTDADDVEKNVTNQAYTDGSDLVVNGNVTITYTNTRQTGDLTISKVTDPEHIEGAPTYKVTVHSEDGYLQDATNISFGETAKELEITAGTDLKIKGVPVGDYTIEEILGTDNVNVQVDGYRYDGTENVSTEVTVTKENTADNPATVTITNKYTELVDVTVTKEFSGIDKDDIPTNFQIEYTITETGKDNVTGTLTKTGDIRPTISTDGLKWTWTVPTVAAGTTFTATESNYAATGYKSNTQTSDVTKSITVSETTKSISYTNTYELGSLTITKAFDGVTLTDDQKNGVSFTVTGPNNYSATFTYAEMTEGSKTLTGLKLGEYTVEETAALDGYKVTMNPASGSASTTLSAEKMSDTLAFTNTYELGSLTITKAFDGVTLTDDQKKGVSFTVTGPNNYSATFTYAEMTEGSKTLTGLKLGEYTVEETAALDGYKVTMNPASGSASTTLSAEKMSDTLAFTNTYELGELTITKVVTGLAEGDVIPANTTFTVKTGEDTYATFTYGDMTNGSYTLNNVPIDATYSVEESGAEVTGYKLDTTISDAVALSSTTMTGEITVTNTYSQGGLKITKQWPGDNTISDEDKKALSITIEGKDVNPTAEGDAKNTLIITYEDFTNGVYTIENLPAGEKYTVKETNAAGLSEYYTFDTENSTFEVKDVEVKADETAEVTLSNKYNVKTTTITVTKEWLDDSNSDGMRPAPDTTFAGLLQLSDGGTQPVTGYTPSITDNGDNTWTITYSEIPIAKDGVVLTYSVQEAQVTGYDEPTYTNTDTAVTDKALNGGTITNNRTTVNVKVKKLVEGNMGDTQKDFNFTASMTGTGTDAEPVTLGTFTLKHNDEYTIQGVHVGTTLTITETEAGEGGYTTTVEGAVLNGKAGILENVQKPSDPTKPVTITFTNTKTAEVDTGINLDFLPYVTILGIAGLGLIAMMIKRRRKASR